MIGCNHIVRIAGRLKKTHGIAYQTFTIREQSELCKESRVAQERVAERPNSTVENNRLACCKEDC